MRTVSGINYVRPPSAAGRAMKYRDIKRRMKQLAAEHLDSLEVYDEFEEDDAENVNRAKFEIQCELIGRPNTAAHAATEAPNARPCGGVE